MKQNVSIIKNEFGTFELTDDGSVVTGVVRLFENDEIPAVRGKSAFSEFVKDELAEYFAGTRKDFHDIPIVFHGTPFREKVWNALLKIPYGEVRTYGEIAEEIGCIGGGRAVGQAVHHNPILLIIPCHRIVASNGLGGFGAGMDLKMKLMRLEGVL